MRVLDFTGEKASERFDMTYGGFVISPRGFTKGEARVAASILNKFEVYARPIEKKAGSSSPVENELRPGVTAIVTLEEAEFKLLNEALAENRWSALGARKFADCCEWLDSIKETVA